MAIGITHNGSSVVLDVNLNADSLEYGSKPNTIVFTEANSTSAERESLLTLLKTVARKYLKRVNNVISEMTQGEEDAVDAAASAAIIAAAKAQAKALYLALDNMGRVIRAISKLSVDENNILRQWLAAFKVEVAAASNLADLKSRVAGLPATADRTYTQAKNAIDALVDAE